MATLQLPAMGKSPIVAFLRNKIKLFLRKKRSPDMCIRLIRLPSGPRLPAAWNYGAVEAALRDASSRGERSIFLPYQGQVFQSLEEAFEFYNMYSWEAGFGIRFGRSRINRSNNKTRQDIVCSCEVPFSYAPTCDDV
jgi:hypothetical protein